MPEVLTDDIRGVLKKNVSVLVWESKVRIKLNVSSGKNKQISMTRIAGVAVNAILEGLKKEG